MHRSTRIVVLGLVLAAFAAEAKKIYKYVDEHGVTHYTDVAPEAENVESRTVRVDNPTMISMRAQDTRDGRRDVYFFNHWWGPAELRVRIHNASDIDVSGPARAGSVVLPAYQETLAMTIRATGPQAGYQMQFSAIPGDPNARPDQAHVYPAPFRGGEFVIAQAFGGTFSHTNPENRFAVDIGLPEGTPVVAVRSGIVMSVEDDYYNSGTRQSYASRANNVRVLHPDGGMAVYAHLQTESVRVRPGQRVREGERLGSSGNTGYSTGPHLHFSIQENNHGELQSIPFVFETGEPRAGQMLRGQ